MSMPAHFKRTECACPDCVAPCKRQPGPLALGDFERIAAFLGQSLDDARAHFVASPGAMVRNSRTNEVRWIRTITPRTVDRRGRCVFLDANDRCAIHAVAPFGCAYADTHMPDAVWNERALWLYSSVDVSEEYRRLRSTLKLATTHNPVRAGGK